MFRRVALAGLAALVFASCSGDGDGASTTTTFFSETTTSSALTASPVLARVLSPDRASVQGRAGRGMVVALTFTARDATVLPATFRLGGALPPPAPSAKPGHNPAFPGLVVGLSTTGTALGGPSTNLANLFQIVSPSLQLDGSAQVSAVWTNTQVDFGSDVEATLVAYVVSGTAPDVIPATQANVDVISNTAEVTFRVSPVTDPSGAVADVSPATTAPAPPAGGATTTTARPTTTTTRPVTTTVAPTTTRPSTTVPPTTTTTKFLGLF